MSAGQAQADGLLLHIRVTPRCPRNAITGIGRGSDGRHHLAVRVTASPHDGEANEAVRLLIAKEAGLSRSSVQILTGHQGREKKLKLDGDPKALVAWLGRVEVVEVDR